MFKEAQIVEPCAGVIESNKLVSQSDADELDLVLPASKVETGNSHARQQELLLARQLGTAVVWGRTSYRHPMSAVGMVRVPLMMTSLGLISLKASAALMFTY